MESKLTQVCNQEDFSQALKIDAAKWPSAYKERGLTYALSGAREAAIADLTAYNSLSPGDPEVILALQALGAGAAPADVAPPAATLDPGAAPGAAELAPVSIIPMVQDGSTYAVPVAINGQLTLKFVVDGEAADVSLPSDVVTTLIRTGTIAAGDFIGRQTYALADGSKVPSKQFIIRSLKIGERVVENVRGSIFAANSAPLLGESFLDRFRSWTVDNERRALILK